MFVLGNNTSSWRSDRSKNNNQLRVNSNKNQIISDGTLWFVRFHHCGGRAGELVRGNRRISVTNKSQWQFRNPPVCSIRPFHMRKNVIMSKYTKWCNTRPKMLGKLSTLIADYGDVIESVSNPWVSSWLCEFVWNDHSSLVTKQMNNSNSNVREWEGLCVCCQSKENTTFAISRLLLITSAICVSGYTISKWSASVDNIQNTRLYLIDYVKCVCLCGAPQFKMTHDEENNDWSTALITDLHARVSLTERKAQIQHLDSVWEINDYLPVWKS